MLNLNITFHTFILWSVQAVHTPSLARPSVLTQQHMWLFDLYLCSSSCRFVLGRYIIRVSVLQPHSSVMFVSEPLCPLSVEYNESIIKGSPISKTCV